MSSILREPEIKSRRDLVSLGGNQFNAVFPASACGTEISFFFSGTTTNNVTWREPSTAPAVTFQAISASSQTILVADDLELDTGWSVGDPGDTATTGIWTRTDPVGTAAQTEDDHSPDPATTCFVTGQGIVGGGLGDNDVDGGATTLISPTFDGAQENSIVSYWRWFSNDAGGAPNTDSFVIDISNDDGANWTNAELVGPTGPETGGGWFFHQFFIADVIVPTSTMRMRFVASDLGSGSIVEAAIDDFTITSLQCLAPCPVADGDLNLDTFTNGADVQAFVDALLGAPTFDEMCAGDFNTNSQLDLGDASGFVAALLAP